MSYQFLCPKCGRGFLEGTSLKDCPDCGVPLEHTAPAGQSESETAATEPLAAQAATILGLAATSHSEATPFAPLTPALSAALSSNKLPEHLDIDELMRKVLDEQAEREDIDAALKRVLARDFPAAADPLYQLISLQFDLYQQAGKTRQQAAEELAPSQSELIATSGGRQIKSTHFTSVKGLENLPPAMRQLIEKQLLDAVGSGKPLSGFKMHLGGGVRVVGAADSAGGKSVPFTRSVSFSGPLSGMSAPAEFCSLALEELEAAGVAHATQRTARVDKLWASPRLQQAYGYINSRPVQFAVPATIATIALTAVAGLQPGFVLAAAIAAAFATGGLVRNLYKSRLKSALREEIEFSDASK